MKRRIGILTSGGDCPGLNACIRGVARASYSMFDTEIVGIQDGYAGLIAGDYKEMKQSDFSGILTLGGTILGTRRTPFRNMRVIEDDNVDKVKRFCDYADYVLDLKERNGAYAENNRFFQFCKKFSHKHLSFS